MSYESALAEVEREISGAALSASYLTEKHSILRGRVASALSSQLNTADAKSAVADSWIVLCVVGKMIDELKIKATVAPVPQAQAYILVDLWGRHLAAVSLLKKIADIETLKFSSADLLVRLAALSQGVHQLVLTFVHDQAKILNAIPQSELCEWLLAIMQPWAGKPEFVAALQQTRP